MSSVARLQRVIILPGNGCTPIAHANWYKWGERALNETGKFEAICREMPDPDRARMSIWLPFIRDELKPDADTIIVGHSSGAQAALRLAETQPLKGLILVSACHTDLGIENEQQSGWYSAPWPWSTISANCNWIVQLHSFDDPFIPMSEAETVAEGLKSEFIRHEKRGHYMRQQMPDVIEILLKKLEQAT